MKSIFLFAFLFVAFASFTYSTGLSDFTNVENYELNEDYIEFTLHNKSEKSIPLIIPNVMNPNLSPNSKSGVSLKVGQEILYRYKGKKRVLFIVSPQLRGQEIEVSAILKEAIEAVDSGVNINP